MTIGRVARVLGIAALWFATCLAMSGCGADENAAVPPAEAGPDHGATRVPDVVADLLRRDGIEVVDASFDGGLSAQASLAAFAETYDLAMFDAAPSVYAVAVISSGESRLPDGLVARMVHVPGVEQDRAGPMQPDHSPPAADIVETDLFAFFEAETGRHLATVHIGPLR
jgi:hypothetical protein